MRRVASADVLAIPTLSQGEPQPVTRRLEVGRGDAPNPVVTIGFLTDF